MSLPVIILFQNPGQVTFAEIPITMANTLNEPLPMNHPVAVIKTSNSAIFFRKFFTVYKYFERGRELPLW